MFTCFLFAEHFDDDTCLSLRLDELGQVNEPLMRRTIDELRLLQTNARTIVVLPTEISSLYDVELPWLSDSKARAALPYAIEEQLAQPVTMLHCSFDHHHYQHNRYLVVVIDKHIVIDLMDKLERLQLTFDVITLDWFALQLGEACVIGNNLLANDVTFKGALSIDLFDNYLKNQTDYSHVLVFQDNVPIAHAEQCTHVDSVSYVWIAERLWKQRPMNLCQGDFQHNTSQQKTKRWYQLAGILGCVWLVGLLVMNASLLVVLKRHLAELDAKTAVVYHQFFPEARQVISPRFRIGQLLKQNESGHDALVWRLLAKCSNALFPTATKSNGASIHPNEITIQRIRFQNKTLFVTLACRDFAALEQLEARLHHERLTVHQAEAATKANQVIATLELT